MSSGFGVRFHGITRRVFARLRKKAHRNGLAVAQSAGEAVRDGVRIQWNYDPDTELLEVGCVRAPFWIDPNCVNKKLSHEIEAALGVHRAA
jgi:hypothetical protein